jgi:hypothetical protein
LNINEQDEFVLRLGKLLFPCAKDFTLIAKYWLVPGMDYSGKNTI